MLQEMALCPSECGQHTVDSVGLKRKENEGKKLSEQGDRGGSGRRWVVNMYATLQELIKHVVLKKQD